MSAWYDPDDGISWYLILLAVVIVAIPGVLAGIAINDHFL